MKRYDAIIIGTGQAGPALAGQFTSNGMSVAIAEGYKIGGSCVNYGCIPSKTIIASARAAHMARRGADFGVNTGAVKVDMNAVIDRKANRVGDAQGGLEAWLRGIDTLDVYDVYASFEGTENGLHRVRMGDEVIESERVYINTGARHRVPDIEGLDSVDYLTNEGILEQRTLPEHLVILGGGYIALEMGQAFRRFGSDVTIIESSESIVKHEDEDIRDHIRGILTNEGITVIEGKRAVNAAQAADGTKTLTLQAADGTQSTISGSHLLVAVGRTPNSDKLNLDSVGVETNERGYIITDEYLQTTVPGIWAMGDVNGRGAFTHTSYQDFEIVWDNFNGGTRKVTDRNMAYALYIDPPLGRVGMTEREARESGKNVLIATKPMSHIGRALEQGETQGMIKLLVDADTEQFLGAAVLGFHGDDVIQIISYYMATGASYKHMQNALPIHPTIGEFMPTILGELAPLE